VYVLYARTYSFGSHGTITGGYFSLSILSDFYYRPGLFIYLLSFIFISLVYTAFLPMPIYRFYSAQYIRRVYRTEYKPRALKSG